MWMKKRNSYRVSHKCLDYIHRSNLERRKRLMWYGERDIRRGVKEWAIINLDAFVSNGICCLTSTSIFLFGDFFFNFGGNIVKCEYAQLSWANKYSFVKCFTSTSSLSLSPFLAARSRSLTIVRPNCVLRIRSFAYCHWFYFRNSVVETGMNRARTVEESSDGFMW